MYVLREATAKQRGNSLTSATAGLGVEGQHTVSVTKQGGRAGGGHVKILIVLYQKGVLCSVPKPLKTQDTRFQGEEKTHSKNKMHLESGMPG